MIPVYVNGDSVAGPNFDWLWYCIPKNASRSLLRLLTEAGGERLQGAGKDLRRRIEAGRPKYTFVFVRHPEARIISAWRNKVHAPPKTPAQAKLMEKSLGLREGMALNEFVDWLAGEFRRGPVDKHWRPQSDYVCDKSGKVAATFIGKIERLEDDFLEVRQRIGIHQPIPRMNATKESADEILSARSKEILRTLYRRDFEVFGYNGSA